MARGESDHSVSREDFTGRRGRKDVDHEPALGGHQRPENDEDRARASVWDEPAGRLPGAKPPEGARTYAAWYSGKLQGQRAHKAWFVAFLLALVGGPFSIVGTFLGSGGTGSTMAPLMIVFIAPVVEEMLKAGATLITLERKPYLFTSGRQIVLAVVMSGLCFAVIENILYVTTAENPSKEYILWRWIICTALHLTCSTIASFGLLRMFKHSRKGLTPPDIRLAAPFLLTAMIVHGAYNGSAVILQFVLTPMSS